MKIVGFKTKAPTQWRKLLNTVPWLVADAPERVRSEDVVAKARMTFRHVQDKFEYMPDFGGDKWELPRLCENAKHYRGDCEDFVIKCFEQLINDGVPVGSLRFSICKTERGEGHMVGVITTHEGLIIIDQRKPSVEFADHDYFMHYTFTCCSLPGASHWLTCA